VARVRRAAASGLDGPAPAGPAPADPPADPEAVARQICLQLLTAAPRTRAQLSAALARRGVPQDAADAVLERFADVQLIDDALFARIWVDSRHRGRGLSRRALAAELRQRGVAAEDIQSAVSSLAPEQEEATARALVERRIAATRGLPAAVRIRRLTGMLARKGYPPGLSYRVVRSALAELPPDGSSPDEVMAGAAFDGFGPAFDGPEPGLEGPEPDLDGPGPGFDEIPDGDPDD
jgi:regulatory protein